MRSSPAQNLNLRVSGAGGKSKKAQEAKFFSEPPGLHVKTNRRAVWLCVLHPQRGAGALERFCVDVVSEPAVRAVNPHGKEYVGAVFRHKPGSEACDQGPRTRRAVADPSDGEGAVGPLLLLKIRDVSPG